VQQQFAELIQAQLAKVNIKMNVKAQTHPSSFPR
jgi:hypothetical protein